MHRWSNFLPKGRLSGNKPLLIEEGAEQIVGRGGGSVFRIMTGSAMLD
jgi:hypothetical protein